MKMIARRASLISKAICGIRRTPRKRSARRPRSRTRRGAHVALTLSDAFCVGRYRAEFLELIRKGTVDLVFANESELHSLYQTADFDTAVKALRGEAKLAVVTRSEKGCVVVTRNASRRCRRRRSRSVVDVTGAGDLFAAGFLFGLARGRDHRTAARLGALAAAEVIQHIGARPEVSLKELAEENGFCAGGLRGTNVLHLTLDRWSRWDLPQFARSPAACIAAPATLAQAIGNRLVTERG